ncbi:phage integrase SAM-like domain-containing protein [Sphingobacterium corticis]|uniref:phage integrase SAM-like domain-containing protein n=1 Tax=Sphingobacterium corticis TaxID=1812823 RepID=UPI0036D274FD
MLDKVNAELAEYRRKIGEIGPRLAMLDVEDLKTMLNTVEHSGYVDFIRFYREYLERLLADGKVGTHRTLRSPLNHLTDFIKTVNANDVDSVFLKEFEAHLRKEKTITRSNHGKAEHIVKSSLDDPGVFKVMEAIRNIHNKCKEAYNSERNTVITSEPFKYYKMPKYKMKRKDMDKDIVQKIIAFRDAQLDGRKALARDIFMLSFYLCGMNAKDMYDGKYIIKDGRLEYERAKTAGRRSDNAFISVNVPDVAISLLETYNVAFLHRRFANHEGFKQALSSGMKGSGFTFYNARDSFASIAVNICKFNHNMVESALNHFDESKVINRYAARDWSIIDEVQEGVLSKII